MSTEGVEANRAPWVRRVALGHVGLRLGIILSLLFLLIGFVSITWTPYPLDRINLSEQLQNPSLLHWLGTDHLGRDLVSMVMKGTLASFIVAAIAVVIGMLFGVPPGLAAAAWGRRADRAASHAGDFLSLFPALVVAILIATAFGPGALSAMIAIGIVNIGVFARVTGSSAAMLWKANYVAAARLAGLSAWEAAKRHLLPAISPVILVQALRQLAFGVLSEAALSYVGVGIQPPGTSLGLMLREAQSFMLVEPLPVLVPGIAIALIALALNLAAEGLGKLIDTPLARLGADRVAG
ncbi:MAG: ABC transporter permease [Devosia sp.]|nr:ABC transporter permease [Devosia sp.]